MPRDDAISDVSATRVITLDRRTGNATPSKLLQGTNAAGQLSLALEESNRLPQA